MLSMDHRILDVRRDSGTNEIINWNNLIGLMANKEHPATIFYKNSHTEEVFKSITFKRQKNKVRDFTLTPLNRKQPKMPEAKYSDLVTLCQGNIPLVKLKGTKISSCHCHINNTV
ncbi:hypothetical protein PoB_000220100 [Plakobranchus ocellatus]|uniref:Uncharacterized protein n=1 Tax=Plakobranchus ocellatus TaxID=259542 RepID=A0AAV3X8F2_9GAST|nr:hypothetical protein PoB_000220100 [Plakobranchus ocellatus]